jgi:hypothetical protein
MRIRQFLGIVLVATFALVGSVVYAQFGTCVLSSLGQPVCAPPSGGISADSLGQILCGPGQCIKSDLGQIVCSSVSGGGAVKTNLGQIVCVGGCTQASANFCVRPRN